MCTQDLRPISRGPFRPNLVSMTQATNEADRYAAKLDADLPEVSFVHNSLRVTG